MEVSSKELQERLKWSLEQKIDHSLYVIENFLALYPNSKVAFSGGIDSTVMLYLVRFIDKDRVGVFANTTNEFSEILQFVRTIDNIDVVKPAMSFFDTVERYGFPLVSKKVARMIHDVRNPTERNVASRNLYLTGVKRDGSKTLSYKISERWKPLIDVKFDLTSKCCDILKKKPMNKVMGSDGVFIGTMASDSELRQISYLRTGCINTTSNQCNPLSIWTKEDVWEFVRRYNIPYCDVYDKGEKQTGCAYCGFGCHLESGSRFDRLRIREPKRYDQMMKLENNGVTYKEAINKILSIAGRERLDEWLLF